MCAVQLCLCYLVLQKDEKPVIFSNHYSILLIGNWSFVLQIFVCWCTHDTVLQGVDPHTYAGGLPKVRHKHDCVDGCFAWPRVDLQKVIPVKKVYVR